MPIWFDEWGFQIEKASLDYLTGCDFGKSALTAETPVNTAWSCLVPEGQHQGNGLKIRCPQGRVGSSPTLSTGMRAFKVGALRKHGELGKFGAWQ